ncbi:hypothetical protein MYX76_02480 [Desulfobacterota bacterium AH_259_B03_O07]|nr:hypothetical protein [Desulfobacterota bacterium AH_259_B03_O07]
MLKLSNKLFNKTLLVVFLMLISIIFIANRCNEQETGRRCNSDTDCTRSEKCLDGFCQLIECDEDNDCEGRLNVCINLQCNEIACLVDTDCNSLQICQVNEANRRENICVDVDCTDRDASNCAVNQRCNTSSHTCENICADDETWVRTPLTQVPVCKECIKPDEQDEQGNLKWLPCSGVADCPLGKKCAFTIDNSQGYCIVCSDQSNLPSGLNP